MLIKKSDVSFYITYGIVAALLYCIPAFIFLRDTEYSKAWLLYLGNAFFLCVIATAVIALNRRYGGNATTRSLVVGGHVITLIGVVISCIVAFILLRVFAPSLFGSAPSGQVLEGKPTSLDNLFFIIIVNTLVVNFAAGSIPSIILPYTVKKNQTTERGKNVSDPLI